MPGFSTTTRAVATVFVGVVGACFKLNLTGGAGGFGVTIGGGPAEKMVGKTSGTGSGGGGGNVTSGGVTGPGGAVPNGRANGSGFQIDLPGGGDGITVGKGQCGAFLCRISRGR